MRPEVKKSEAKYTWMRMRDCSALAVVGWGHVCVCKMGPALVAFAPAEAFWRTESLRARRRANRRRFDSDSFAGGKIRCDCCRRRRQRQSRARCVEGLPGWGGGLLHR